MIVDRVCLGGRCAPMVYKEALINKTECNHHDFCKVVVVDVVTTMMMVLMKMLVSL